MPALKIPETSSPGLLGQEGEGRLINAYLSVEGGRAYWRRVPGLTTWSSGGGTGSRGMAEVSGQVYWASGGTVYRASAGGSVSVQGSLPGSQGVTIAKNNKTPPDVVAAREDGGTYLLNSGVSTYPATQLEPIDKAVTAMGLPNTCNSVAFIDGHFIFTHPDGRMFASNINSYDVPALNFATAEHKTDGLVRGIVHSGVFYAMGKSTIEPWLNTGREYFPLMRGTSVIQVGLLTSRAVAGFEEGWNLNPIFVTAEKTVHELDGYATRLVSTPPVDDFIRRSAVSALEAYVYTHRGHAVWALSSDIGTWCYDVTSKRWHERQSLGSVRWRGSGSVKIGDAWVLADTAASGLVTVDENSITERGAVPEWYVEAHPLLEYPARLAIPAVYANVTMNRGQGSLQTSWSLDGGVTWSAWYSRSIAPKAGPVRVNRLGMSTHHGIRVRFRCTDAVNFSMSGAEIPDADKRRP